MKIDVRVLGFTLCIGAVASFVHWAPPEPVAAFPQPQISWASSAASRGLLTATTTAQVSPSPIASLTANAHRLSQHRKRRGKHHKPRLKHAVAHHRGRHPRHHSVQRVAQAALNLNQATVAQLQALPGITPLLASRIIAVRAAGVGFDSVEDLLDVEGVTSSELARIAPRLKVGRL
jgi:DNA uptake protein ComE-like DNA-binding protein